MVEGDEFNYEKKEWMDERHQAGRKGEKRGGGGAGRGTAEECVTSRDTTLVLEETVQNYSLHTHTHTHCTSLPCNRIPTLENVAAQRDTHTQHSSRPGRSIKMRVSFVLGSPVEVYTPRGTALPQGLV